MSAALPRRSIKVTLRPLAASTSTPASCFVQRHSTITVNIPWLVRGELLRGYIDHPLNKWGEGDRADCLVLVQYSFRF